MDPAMTDRPTIDAIRIDPADNVGTVLRPVGRGETIAIGCGGVVSELDVREDIPLCHKIALSQLSPGDRILKYGETIGEATAKIQPGAHVHVHNLRSLRARVRQSS